LDGYVTDRNDFWVLVGREDEDTVGMMLGESLAVGEPPLRICRAILDDDVLLIGDSDPEQDCLLSELLEGDDGGSA